MKSLATAALIAAAGGFAGMASAEELTAPIAVQSTQDNMFGALDASETATAIGGIALAVVAIELAQDDDDNGGSSGTATTTVAD